MAQLEQADSKQRRQQAPRGHQVGTIHELWRYPVKSMLGTTVNEIFITEHGALGDRAWALRDVDSGRIASAKKFPRLLEFRATYEVEPTRSYWVSPRFSSRTRASAAVRLCTPNFE
jgi:uncharacterized protein YcbX